MAGQAVLGYVSTKVMMRVQAMAGQAALGYVPTKVMMRANKCISIFIQLC